MIQVNIPNVEIVPAPDPRIDAIVQQLKDMTSQLAALTSAIGAQHMDIQATLDALNAAQSSLTKISADQAQLLAKIDQLLAQLTAMNDPRLDQIQALAQAVRDQAAAIDATVSDAPPAA